MLTTKQQNKWIGLLLILLLLLSAAGCSRVDPGTETSEPTGETMETEETANTKETESDETQPEVPDEWHIFEYDGVKYDFWNISELVNGVSEWGHIGKYVIAEGHVNPNMCVYAVIDTETQTMVHHFAGTVPTYHSDDINTLVYAYWNNVVAYDGTTLAAYGLQNGEYIDSLSYTEDKSCVEVVIEGTQNSRTEIVNLIPFDAEAFFADIPAEWSQRLFWHQIRGTADYMYFCNYRGVNSTLDGLKKDPPTRFSIYHVNSENLSVIGYIGAEVPSDIIYDTVCPVVVMDGAGSTECEFIVQLTDEDRRFYVSFDNFDCRESGDHLTFTCRGVLSEERVNELKSVYPEDFAKAEQYFWHYDLSDFKNGNSGDSLVYEGYTVEYTCNSSYSDTFDFHIHLPQVNDDSVYADKWNWAIRQEYETQFGEYLQKTAFGINENFFACVTYETVTTGDVVTIYIINTNGILNSGAWGRTYDIYHYDTVQKRFLSTDEFIAYYAEGQFADYTVADIVKFMNEHVFSRDDGDRPYTLSEENIHGVIPSVFGDGKFDVVYTGFTLEGRGNASRVLFSPYPTYGAKNPKTGLGTEYTYRLTYQDYTTCADKELYGKPAGYRLVLTQRVDDQYFIGYSPDCLLTEDIAEPPESYPLGEYGGYYTPVQQDAYGNMFIVIDHETDRGHLNAWIPFDIPDTAQDYYWGVHNKYFSYDRILDGTNYQVNQNIAEQVAQVLDAYRNGKDPNELLPASATDYMPYPLEAIRENPTHQEIGEILKNTSIGENGIINFGIDLGDGWRMALPIGIGGFGDGAQAYFTGVYFAHGTPTNDLTTNDAVELLKEQLIIAYENTYGEFVSSDEEPSTFTGDKERLSYIIPRLTVKEETDQYYIISVIWDFYVNKETHEIFKYYNGIDEMFIPFDPQSDTALSFAG